MIISQVDDDESIHPVEETCLKAGIAIEEYLALPEQNLPKEENRPMIENIKQSEDSHNSSQHEQSTMETLKLEGEPEKNTNVYFLDFFKFNTKCIFLGTH